MNTNNNKNENENENEYWLPIESDPLLFNNYLQLLTKCNQNNGNNNNGQLYFIDIPSIELVNELGIFDCNEILAYIFLYPIDSYKCLGKLMDDYDDNNNNKDQVYFMRQFVHNACASIALFHAYINTVLINNCMDDESIINKFYKQTQSMNAIERGNLFAKNLSIKNLHENIAINGQSELPNNDEQLTNINYHYVTFISTKDNNKIIELDGRKTSPIIHDNNNNIDFKQMALNIIKNYMNLDPNNLNYSILALCKSK